MEIKAETLDFSGVVDYFRLAEISPVKQMSIWNIDKIMNRL